MRTIVIAGARPNFVKVAPLLRSLGEVGADPVLVHTGQHYDFAMSESLFVDLGIPAPDVNLGVGSASHGVQTATVMSAFDAWLDDNKADQVVTVGDVNSTVACALVAVKRGLPVAHVEAGLRSFDRTMPEEANRVVVDALSTWLFTPSADADENLRAEGVDSSRIHRVGNIMVDSLLASVDRAMHSTVRDDLDLEAPFGLITLHRPALVDDAARLRDVLIALQDIATELRLVFPVHPRTRANLDRFGLSELAACLQLVEPLRYLDFLRLQADATVVFTDSGGIQEETTVLGVPCLTLRENTERPITITEGTNQLVGLDPDRIRSAFFGLDPSQRGRRPELWDGQTAARTADILMRGTPDVVWQPRAFAFQG